MALFVRLKHIMDICECRYLMLQSILKHTFHNKQVVLCKWQGVFPVQMCSTMPLRCRWFSVLLLVAILAWLLLNVSICYLLCSLKHDSDFLFCPSLFSVSATFKNSDYGNNHHTETSTALICISIRIYWISIFINFVPFVYTTLPKLIDFRLYFNSNTCL